MLLLSKQDNAPQGVANSSDTVGRYLMTQAELVWFYGGGAAAFFPDIWARFVSIIPPDEQGDLISAYHRRLFSGVLAEETRAAKLWAAWENALASVNHTGPMGESPAEYARAFARLENHYFANAGFLETDGWILENRATIAHIPTVIVQGRYDMICPPVSSWRLAEGWPACELKLVPLAGHALSEPGISEALVGVMNGLRQG